MSIGNIAKEKRRQPSSHSTVLLGYIPVSKLTCFSDSTRSIGSYRLFHYCMSRMFEPLIKAGREGVPMTCADGFSRLIFPILAAYIADHPEQCLVAACRENHCPKCYVPPTHRGEPVYSEPRDQERTLTLIKHYVSGRAVPTFKEEGIRPIDSPFWSNLPHCDIFSCISPDILHQLHKGLFKDHLSKWCALAAGDNGDEEIDLRFRIMSDFWGLRRFKDGVSHVKQWTGKEIKEMEKTFIGILTGIVVEDVVKCASSALDFIYYAQFQKHTDKTLAMMDKAFDDFHTHKDVFIRLGIRDHFNIPKIHALIHYVPMIRSLGCADGYNTEASERFHIDYTKDTYRSTNRKAYMHQMTRWLSRREAAHQFDTYLQWCLQQEHPQSSPAIMPSNAAVGLASTSMLETSPVANETPAPWSYKIARNPHHQKVSFQQLLNDYGAQLFIPALHTYLKSRQDFSGIVPSELDVFDLYNHFDIPLAPISALSETSVPEDAKLSVNKVRAVPLARGESLASNISRHAKFDTVLVKVNDSDTLECTRGTALTSESAVLFDIPSIWVLIANILDVRAAQVRVIFDLPQHFLHPYQDMRVRLAYIEWFRPFRQPDSTNNMFRATRAWRSGHPVVGIVPLDHIVGTCHLIPQFGTGANASWTHENILTECKRFYLNPWIDIRTFYLLRCT
jgi:hypothetical protein